MTNPASPANLIMNPKLRTNPAINKAGTTEARFIQNMVVFLFFRPDGKNYLALALKVIALIGIVAIT